MINTNKMASVTSEQARLEDQIRRLEGEIKTHATRYLTYTTTDARGKSTTITNEELAKYLTEREGE
jgi:hypothetical protein